MKRAQNRLEDLGEHGLWFLRRGLWLACLMEGAALWLALRWGGGPEGSSLLPRAASAGA